MGRSDRQAAARALRIVGAGTAHVVSVVEHLLGHRRDDGADLGQPDQALADAHEQIDAEFLLELADLPAHARLRSVQFPGDLGQV